MKILFFRNLIISFVIVFLVSCFVFDNSLSEALEGENVVRSYEEFKEYVKVSILQARDNIDVVVENYDSDEYSLGRVINELGESVPETSFLFAGASNGTIRGNSNSTQRRVTYDIKFRESEHFDVLENLDRVNDKEGLKSVIKKDLHNYESSTYVRIDNYIRDEYRFGDVIQDVKFENSNIGTGYSGVTSTIYGTGQDVVVRLNYRFNFSKEDRQMMESKASTKAKEVIDELINPYMKDYERLLLIHDYIVNNTSYDYDNYLQNTIPPESRTMYGVLINGVAVCEGYAYALKYLLDLSEVENIIIVGTAGSDAHAWNMVKIQGDYYHVDVTWNDPVTSSRQTRLRHDYFNLTDNELAKTHNWDRAKYPLATKTTYNYENVKNAIETDKENRRGLNIETDTSNETNKNNEDNQTQSRQILTQIDEIRDDERYEERQEDDGLENSHGEIDNTNETNANVSNTNTSNTNEVNLSEDSIVSSQQLNNGILMEDPTLSNDDINYSEKEAEQTSYEKSQINSNQKSEERKIASKLSLTIGSRIYFKDGNPGLIDEQESVKPYIKDGRTMLPIRFLVENLGGNMHWDSNDSRVVVRKDGKQLSFKPGHTSVVIDGVDEEMEIPSEILHGRTFVPVRFVSENLDVNVSWDPLLEKISLNHH